MASRGPAAPAPTPAAPQAAGSYEIAGPENTVAVAAPMQGTIVSFDVREGDAVRQGQQLLVMEAMKMEHVIHSPTSGIVRRITVAKGDTVFEGHPLVFIEEGEVDASAGAAAEVVDLEYIRPDLAEVMARHEIVLDAARPDSVARRRKTGQRTARENVEDLCDPGTFVEFGPLVVAAQRRRRTMEDLIRNTPADGLITGHATINGDLFGPERSHCVVIAYDFTVLAGTQGHLNHRKKDRMFEMARNFHLPLVLFAEGGGGRPGDTDGDFSSRTFHDFATLSGLVPLVGIVSGRCFAGNASLLGCCDVIIATKNIEHRDGRAGDDRKRRPGRLSSRRGRSDRRPGAQRRGRYRGRRRSRSGHGGEAVSVLLSGRDPRLGMPRSASAAQNHP